MSAEGLPYGGRPRRPVVLPAVTFLSLVIGFAIAQSTGLRWLGAVVLLFGGIACALAMMPVEGVGRTAVLAVVYVGALVLSHPLGNVIGAWPSVLLVAAVTAVVAYVLIRPTGRRVSTT